MAGWVTRTAGRISEMNPKISLRLEVHRDGDIAILIEEDGVPIEDQAGNVAKVEFCNTSNGGGRSPKTRAALFNVLTAMLEDAKEMPDGIPRFPDGLREAMLG